ncbi:tyrosine-type recombinase/integrase [uncultured Exiguobacterium sp.]|uniref:tyrosine-type recombinase/integrase n=1 Tax=uncultured Exiguobacterium sp. TaxID=202669 RepID=UPI0025E4BBD2|nr:tyrosine-type recombinase/integrase [uncultured Exiguobacterium sp.]
MQHGEYLHDYLISHPTFAKPTIKAYRSDVRHMERAGVSWSIASLQHYFDQMRMTYQPSTILRRFHALRSLGNVLVRAGKLQENPLHDVSPITHQCFPDETYHDLQEGLSIVRSIEDPVYRLFFEVICQTGLRFTEARLLSVTDIDFKTHTLFVRYGKGRRLRTIPIGMMLSHRLLHFIGERKEGILFQSVTGRHLHEQTARVILRDTALRLSGAPLRPHALRIAYATYLHHEGGCTIVEIQRLLGHAHPTTTVGYIRSRTNRIREVLNTLSA